MDVNMRRHSSAACLGFALRRSYRPRSIHAAAAPLVRARLWSRKQRQLVQHGLAAARGKGARGLLGAKPARLAGPLPKRQGVAHTRLLDSCVQLDRLPLALLVFEVKRDVKNRRVVTEQRLCTVGWMEPCTQVLVEYLVQAMC